MKYILQYYLYIKIDSYQIINIPFPNLSTMVVLRIRKCFSFFTKISRSDRRVQPIHNRENDNIVYRLVPKIEAFYQVTEWKKLSNCCDDFCSICLNEYLFDDKIITIRCKHVFHKHCLAIWSKMKNTCPMCRSTMITPFPVYTLSIV